MLDAIQPLTFLHPSFPDGKCAVLITTSRCLAEVMNLSLFGVTNPSMPGIIAQNICITTSKLSKPSLPRSFNGFHLKFSPFEVDKLLSFSDLLSSLSTSSKTIKPHFKSIYRYHSHKANYYSWKISSKFVFKSF